MESYKNVSFTYHQKRAFIVTETDPIHGSAAFNDHSGYIPDILSLPAFRNSPKRHREGVKGLCQDCGLIATCGSYRDDAVIFHCEHYQ